MRFLRDQGLAIAMFGLFAVTLVGLMLAGWSNYNEEQAEHGQPSVALTEYLGTPSFGEAVFEKLGERVPPDGRLCASNGFPVQPRFI